MLLIISFNIGNHLLDPSSLSSWEKLSWARN